MPLCSVTLTLDPSRGRVRAPSPWMWATLGTDFNQKNGAKGMMRDSQAEALRSPTASSMAPWKPTIMEKEPGLD